MKKLGYTLLIPVLLFACKGPESSEASTQESSVSETSVRELAKFEPPDGKCILFVGQELDAIGGLEDYNDGYLDHYDTPGGFTMYTKIRPGDEGFGFTYTGPSGVFTTDNWGDGNSNMSMQVADPDFEYMCLAIGFEFVNHEKRVAAGEHDSLLMVLGNWIKSLGKRPVFLRIGYEFSGEWNHYDREGYVAAYRHIKDLYDASGIENIAYVWQSHGWDEPMELLESWYPGDEYVDWCGYSLFARGDEANMIEFAKQKGKPVFIAEATPTLPTDKVKTHGITKETDLSNPVHAKEAWTEWFVPFFQTIQQNPEVKAVSYINAHWKSRPMWKVNPTFKGIDARLHLNPNIDKKWKEETNDTRFLKASPQLFDLLWNQSH